MKPSLISNCVLIASHEQDGPIVQESARGDGSAFIYMDRYLICPLDMFTPEEIDAASRKYNQAN